MKETRVMETWHVFKIEEASRCDWGWKESEITWTVAKVKYAGLFSKDGLTRNVFKLNGKRREINIKAKHDRMKNRFVFVINFVNTLLCKKSDIEERSRSFCKLHFDGQLPSIEVHSCGAHCVFILRLVAFLYHFSPFKTQSTVLSYRNSKINF